MDSTDSETPGDAPLSGGTITLTTEQLLRIVETARQSQTWRGGQEVSATSSSQQNTV